MLQCSRRAAEPLAPWAFGAYSEFCRYECFHPLHAVRQRLNASHEAGDTPLGVFDKSRCFCAGCRVNNLTCDSRQKRFSPPPRVVALDADEHRHGSADVLLRPARRWVSQCPEAIATAFFAFPALAPTMESSLVAFRTALYACCAATTRFQSGKHFGSNHALNYHSPVRGHFLAITFEQSPCLPMVALRRTTQHAELGEDCAGSVS